MADKFLFSPFDENLRRHDDRENGIEPIQSTCNSLTFHNLQITIERIKHFDDCNLTITSTNLIE